MSSSYALISTTGKIASGQGEFVSVPRGGGRGKPAVVILHSNNQLAEQLWDGTSEPNKYALVDQMARAGLVTVCADLDLDYGSSGWGNPDVQARVQTCWALAQTYGASSTHYSLFGCSEGSTASIMMAGFDPTHIAAMVVGMPLPDLEGLRTLGGAGVQGQINTAWGISPTTQTTPNIQQGGVDVTPLNPVHEAAIASIPKKVYYSSGDPDVMGFYSTLTPWAAATNATLELTSTTLPHGDVQVASYPYTEIVQFLATAG